MLKRISVNTQKLKLEIKKSEYSGKNLVEVAGIKTHDLYNCLNGNGIKYDKLKLICEKLGREPEYFIEDNNYSSQEEVTIEEKDKIPYNPELHKLSLDLLQAAILKEGLEVDFDLIKKMHDKIYNIIVKRDNFNNNLIEGVVISVLDSYAH
jgi:DNA-binding Xre family transcriptional regulator